MLARTIVYTLVALAGGLSLTVADLRGEDAPHSPPQSKQSDQQSSSERWQRWPQTQQPVLRWRQAQRHQFAPTQNTGRWNVIQPTQARVAWNVSSITYSNPLGVEVAPADAALRAQLGLDESKTGVIVTNVREDSEAEKSGLKKHDLILQIGETAIDNPQAFNETVSQQQGKDSEFQILRQGKPVTLPIAVPKSQLYDFILRPAPSERTLHSDRYRIGVVLAPADETLRSQLRIKTGQGLVVTKVLPDTPASKAGLRVHDVLISLDGTRLSRVEKLNQQVQAIKDRKVNVTFLRGGQEKTLELAPELNKELIRVDLVEPGHRSELIGFVNPLRNTSDRIYSNFDAAVQGINEAVQRDANAPLDVARQLAALRDQFAEIQQSFKRLEETLQAEEEEKPTAEPEKQE